MPLVIAAGMMQTKKKGKHHLLNRYLNYGALEIATVLSRKSKSLLLHGKFTDPNEFAQQAAGYLEMLQTSKVLLSIPSFFAMGWSARFIEAITKLRRDTQVIVGGKWVVLDDETWVAERLPPGVTVLKGAAWPRLAELLGFPSPPDSISEWGFDYSLMPDRDEFHPSVEVSRGCGLGCTFCLEAGVRLTAMKPAELVVREMEKYQSLFTYPIRPYIEASFFRPNLEWANRLVNVRNAAGIDTNWRAESRVDSLPPSILRTLASGGLKVLDLGLESASTRQLVAMRKTSNPASYLARADQLLRVASDAGVWVKLNILLYAGETHKSVEETISWLEQRRGLFKGLSVYPVVAYGHGSMLASFINQLNKCGATAIGSEIDGVYNIDLSSEIPYARAVEISEELTARFMPQRDYFDLKSFSYFPPSLSYEEFCSFVN